MKGPVTSLQPPNSNNNRIVSPDYQTAMMQSKGDEVNQLNSSRLEELKRLIALERSGSASSHSSASHHSGQSTTDLPGMLPASSTSLVGHGHDATSVLPFKPPPAFDAEQPLMKRRKISTDASSSAVDQLQAQQQHQQYQEQQQQQQQHQRISAAFPLATNAAAPGPGSLGNNNASELTTCTTAAAPPPLLGLPDLLSSASTGTDFPHHVQGTSAAAGSGIFNNPSAQQSALFRAAYVNTLLNAGSLAAAATANPPSCDLPLGSQIGSTMQLSQQPNAATQAQLSPLFAGQLPGQLPMLQTPGLNLSDSAIFADRAAAGIYGPNLALAAAELSLGRRMAAGNEALLASINGQNQHQQPNGSAAGQPGTSNSLRFNATPASAAFQNRPILPLATRDDGSWLSEYLCFVRSQCVEVFTASTDDVVSRNNSKKIGRGQVGMRCRFCAHLPHRNRTGRSSSFPSSKSRIYQSLTMMLRDHFPKCEEMPPEIKDKFMRLKSTTSQGATDSKMYWVESAESLGMVDTPEGIKFQSS